VSPAWPLGQLLDSFAVHHGVRSCLELSLAAGISWIHLPAPPRPRSPLSRAHSLPTGADDPRARSHIPSPRSPSCPTAFVPRRIKQLSKLLSENAAACMKEQKMADLTGRKIAIDASMAIYQFLVAVRSSDGTGASTQLMNEAGEVTR